MNKDTIFKKIGYKTQNLDCKIQNTSILKYKIQKIQDTAYMIQYRKFKHKIKNVRYRIQDKRYRIQDLEDTR